MKSSFFTFCTVAAGLALSTALAEEKRSEPPPKQATKEEIQARLAEHAKKKAEAAQANAAAEKRNETKPAEAAIGAPVAPAQPGKAPDQTAAAKSAKEETPTVLPKMEVQRPRITELDRQLDKQNREIAREKQATKPTKLDETLNGPGISKALSIFGGQSSDDRASIAQERVAMMEEEKDLIEAIAQAQTKEEKEELQKTLDSMRAMRRELEQSVR
ncbi:hypothetical protein [Opitutus terrae]|uniref:Uncharacterized protein n=1 Tax=Opitutus terrae (strain DSM 11246 / JCM 15787 / PB90-1) TaxID=452637 RepID=B1ZV16_OPITP|nr:hypothetical protein [Opitutus terrae]ACB75986.1 hypothetical protein Oter_2705 [Opitutus terrae PB90-1]